MIPKGKDNQHYIENQDGTSKQVFKGKALLNFFSAPRNISPNEVSMILLFIL